MALGWPAAFAQGWTVARLQVAGQDVPSTRLQVRQGSTGTEALEVRLNQELPGGRTLLADADVEIELHSPGRMRAFKRAGKAGSVMLAPVSASMEQVEVKSGAWGFQRLASAFGKALTPFSASTGSAIASTRGTEFTVEVDETAGRATYAVQEGRIELSWQQALSVQGKATSAGRAGTPPLALQRSVRAGDPPVVVSLRPSDWLLDFANYNDAVAAFAQQVSQAEARGNPHEILMALLSQGDMLMVAGRAEEALASFQRAQALLGRQDDDDGRYWRAVTVGRQGGALQAMYRYGDARRAFEESRALHQQVPAREGERTVLEQDANIALNLLGDGLFQCADARAARLLEPLLQRSFTASHIKAPLLRVRGEAAEWRGRAGPPAAQAAAWADALRWHQDALEVQRTADGATQQASPAVAFDSVALAGDKTALAALGGRRRAVLFREAETLLGGAQEMMDRLFAEAHQLKADALLGRASLRRAQGRPAEALAGVQQVLAVLDSLPADVLRRADALTLQGELLLSLRRPADAAAALRQARELLLPVWPDASHPRFQALLATLARAVRASGGPETEAREAENQARAGTEAWQRREAACPR